VNLGFVDLAFLHGLERLENHVIRTNPDKQGVHVNHHKPLLIIAMTAA
jgi:hypothetical protein